jgi:Ran GTPase-activating protein (RanGAP) involved in mRNA processing and transport
LDFKGVKSELFLEKIQLSSNEFRNLAMMYLADVLETGNSSLETVSCCNNYIGDDAANCIAEMLKFNSSLRNLNIHGNEFTLAGIRVITEALEKNISMQELTCFYFQLRNNRDQDIALENALKQCSVRRGSTFRMLLCRLANRRNEMSNDLFDAQILKLYIFPFLGIS